MATIEGRAPLSRREMLKLGLAGSIGVGLGMAGFPKVRTYMETQPTTQEIGQRNAHPYVEVNNLPLNYKEDLRFPFTESFSGGDGCYSLKLPTGETVVFFSDSFIGGATKDPTTGKFARPDDWMPGDMIHNLAIVLGEHTYSVVTGPKDGFYHKNTTWIKTKEAEENAKSLEQKPSPYYWVQQPIFDKTTNRIQMLLIKSVNLPGRDNTITGSLIGMDIASIDTSSPSPQDWIIDISPLPRSDNKERETLWGAALVNVKDKKTDQTYTYIYGSSKPLKDNQFHAKELLVARVPEGQLNDPSQWQFLKKNGDKKTWVSVEKEAITRFGVDKAFEIAETQATAVIDIAQGLSAGISAHVIDGRVVIVSKEADFLGERIFSFTGDPDGPFTRHELITVPDYNNGSDKLEHAERVNYGALLHPDIVDPTQPDHMLVTLSLNLLPKEPGENVFREHKENAELYQPVAFWIPKNRILGIDSQK